MKKNNGFTLLFLLMKDFKFKISCSLVSGGARKLSRSDLKANACESTWHLSKRHVNVLQALFFRLFPAYTLLRSWQSIPSSKKWQHQLLSMRNRWMILDSWIIPTNNQKTFQYLDKPCNSELTNCPVSSMACHLTISSTNTMEDITSPGK